MSRQTRAPRRLPVLTEASFDKIEIATPCSADWNQMVGDDRVRHCSDCRLNVYNVAAMTRAEAAALIATNEDGRTCLRLYRRADGSLITADCWARLRAARRRGWVAFAAALVIVGLAQLGLRFAALGWLIKWQPKSLPPVTSVEPKDSPPVMGAPPPIAVPVEEPRHMMGEMAALPPSPPKTPPKTPTTPKTPKTPKTPSSEEPPHIRMGKVAAPTEL